MQCKELAAVLESDGLSPLPPEAREHLAGCPTCQDLLADLSAVVVAAKRLPTEVTPPDRIWISIRAQLEAEGIIRDAAPVIAQTPAPWWHGFADLFRPRALATVGAGLFFVLGSIYLVQHTTTTKVAQQPQPVQTQASQPSKTVTPAPLQSNPVAPATHASAPTQSARVAPPPQPRPSSTVLRPSPSENAYLGDSAAVLSQSEDALPRHELANNAAVDASMRQSLRTLNEFIAECEARLKQNPRDQLTREYLNMAYQQKADLLAAMLDSGRSEH
jgi:cell division septation protein DedD